MKIKANVHWFKAFTFLIGMALTLYWYDWRLVLVIGLLTLTVNDH